MGNGTKEDERTERVIRGLLKLPGNRRCINCNILGPQYVCTTFSTFVCTNCSGIHREFTHRVKSVSMAKFTAEEVNALQAGGNERAKQIYFREWDPLRHSYPDPSNIHKLRDFIKHVYVDRKFTGERSPLNLPRLRLNDKEESCESRKINSFGFESKTPQYEIRHERQYSERSSPSVRSDDGSFRYIYDERRSPRYAQKYSGHGGFGRNPKKFEVVDDRFRDNESRSRRLSNLESRLRQLSPDGHKNVDEYQSPVARPVGEVSGKNAPSLRVGEPSQTQSNENNWASFEAYTVGNAPITPNSNTLTSSTTAMTPQATYANTLDLLLFELSSPLTPKTSGLSEVSSGDNYPTPVTKENASASGDWPPTLMGQTTASPNYSDALLVTSTTVAERAQPSNAVPPHVQLYDREDSVKVSHEQKLSSMLFPPSVSVGRSSTTQPSTPVRSVASNSLPSVVTNRHDSSSAFTELSFQTTSKPAHDTRPDVGSQPCKVETKFSGRRELPADLFTTSYLSGPAPLAGRQNVQPHGMEYGLQYYPNAVPPSAFPVAAKSTNPFEETEGRTLVHASSFPTVASLHGVLPAVSPRTGLMHASSLGSLGSLVPQSPSYASPVSPQSTLASGIPTGAYFQQVNNNMQSPRLQRVGSFNGDTTVFGSLGTIQQSGGEYVTTSTPNSFSKTRGNPFE